MKACKAAAAVLEGGGTALAAVEAAIAVLEVSLPLQHWQHPLPALTPTHTSHPLQDCPLTNAAHGSNLTAAGAVECDASAMDGDGAFGAVAAASGIRNPIAAAALLATESSQPLSHGRVRPIMLAGEGARAWAASKGLPTAATPQAAGAMHVTDKSRRQWEKYSAWVAAGEGDDGGVEGLPETGTAAETGIEAGDPHRKRRRRGSSPAGNVCALNDTVGAVAVDCWGRVAAGVSSGGIPLKAPGRVGEAALFGAGCWAQNADGAGQPAAACSVTGVGERIMVGLVARQSAQRAAAARGRELRQGGASAAAPAASVSSACERVLAETVAAGPPPNECGLVCVTALMHAAASGGQGRCLEVDLAAVNCVSESLAVAFKAQGGAGGGRTAQAHVLRRGPALAAGKAQALSFGISWAVS